MSLHYGDAIGYDMLEIPSNPCVSSSVNFNGDITFTVQQPGEECFIVPKMSYISVQIQIIQTREGYGSTVANLNPIVAGTNTLEPIINLGTRLAPTAISVPYITQAPGLALFQNVTCNIKGQTISNFQYAQSVNTLYKMLYESQLDQKTVSNRYKPP